MPSSHRSEPRAPTLRKPRRIGHPKTQRQILSAEAGAPALTHPSQNRRRAAAPIALEGDSRFGTVWYLSARAVISRNQIHRTTKGRPPAYIYDLYAQGITNVAQMISTAIGRGVLAYDVGVYFSQSDIAHDQSVTGKFAPNPPSTLPIYMVPEGAPGRKPNPKPFCPSGSCVQ